MLEKLKNSINLVTNMGTRYTIFRVKHEFLKRSGILKKQFPVNPAFKRYISLEEWKGQSSKFFFDSKETLSFNPTPNEAIKDNFENIAAGKFLLFNSILVDLGKDFDWVTNPDTGHKYNKNKHWTEIADFSPSAGDIKYVWEKSRFSYLYDIIRYDYHFKKDCAELVFGAILSWINANPINCGPNYRCSQEISLRILNWTFALHYYKNSTYLTDQVFDQMQFAIYWQIDHVLKNIDFSRIAVRNNHAITETLTMYLVGLLYPTLPNAAKLKTLGKKWFEEEVAYQIYEDGTFLQFSMNYHRVVVQLLTWAITLSEKNNERFNDTVYDRARKSVHFLGTCTVPENGWLPNYGNNDGALFFKLNNAHFRDYRQQLQALANALQINLGQNEIAEDSLWMGHDCAYKEQWQPSLGTHSFLKGGYFIIRETDTLTFIRCGNQKDRPHQADNLHLDIWYKGENVLLDAGSYKYNTDEATLRYFSGTASHNTVMLGNHDQMLKGSRFIWYYWSHCKNVSIKEENGIFTFCGEIRAFTYLNKNISHKRTVTKVKGEAVWQIMDVVLNKPNTLVLKQIWHMPKLGKYNLKIQPKPNSGNPIIETAQEGWYSSLYGQKEPTNELVFDSDETQIETSLEITQ